MTRRLWAFVGIALFCGSAWVSAQKSAGKLTSDDLVEIQQLYAKYNWTLDAGDAEGYASTFTPEGVFNNNVGHDAIVKFANTFHAGVGAHVHHWNTNLMILPTADGASGQVYLVLVDFATKPASIFDVRHLPRRAREDAAGMALQEAHDQGRRRASARAAEAVARACGPGNSWVRLEPLTART